MGRITVQFDICNHTDVRMAAEGMLPLEKVRCVRIEGTVDTGANHLVLPEAIAQQLGLPANRQITVTYGDRRTETRQLVDDAHLELCGRTGTYSAVVEPNRQTALIGAIVLQDLDLLVDSRNHALIPRHPEYEMTEVETYEQP